MSYGVRHTGSSEQTMRHQRLRPCQRASEQARRVEWPQWPECYISRCHFTYFSDCIVREEGAIMWEREAECSRGLFGELARGSKILTAQLWHQSKQSHNVQWQKQDVIVSHSEKNCGLQCDNRSFNSTSFMKHLPALIGFMMIVPKQQWIYFGQKLAPVYL